MTIVTVNPGELIPKQGTPIKEGRYVAFVRCESFQVKGWLEPEIVTWHGGRWHCIKPIFAWIGPLPLCKWADFKGPVREYDL